ncbi:MAG: nucleotidyl transferase AbiEii/AbiGii toxin family protein [Gammaproteobacteria bacterium]
MNPGRYESAAAFRVALEARLRQRARETGVPLDRLRKEVAHQRLLARLARTAPEGSWALKGGQVLLARLGEEARATKDADATWRESNLPFAQILEQAVDLHLDDYFAFEVGEPRDLEAETDERGLRYPVLVMLDGREFERIQLDINFVPEDPRPFEYLQLRDMLGFAGIEPPGVPVVPVAQHLAEKLHAYTRRYAHDSSRPRDLFDILVIALSLPLPLASDLAAAFRQTFEMRRTAWPPELPPPPASWARTWETYVEDHKIPWTGLDDAYLALGRFLRPLLEEPVGTGSNWDPAAWEWSVAER